MLPRSFSSVVSGRGMLKQSLITLILIFALGQLMLSANRTAKDFDEESLVAPEQKTKNILIWNSHQTYTFRCFGFGEEAFVINNCKVQNCRLLKNINDVSDPSEIDAFIINVNHVSSPDQVPRIQRKNHQRFVLFTLEPAGYMGFSKVTHKYGDMFNSTMTYRHNSDINLRYGRVHKRRVTLPDYKANPKVNKTKLVAWFVSNCYTSGRRENLVKELQQYVPVDIYGECGTLKCPKTAGWVSSSGCYDHLEANYKFYLAFENSLCKDYVTEKFFYILQRRVVPIVYGSADYEAIAPPHSYIDATKYTPKDLADYLTLLDKNDTLYQEYFAWKKNYWAESGPEQTMKYGFCDLCQKLHEDEGKVKILSKEDLYREFDRQNQCDEPL